VFFNLLGEFYSIQCYPQQHKIFIHYTLTQFKALFYVRPGKLRKEKREVVRMRERICTNERKITNTASPKRPYGHIDY